MATKQWLEQIKVALLHDEPSAFESLSFEKPWANLSALEREQLAEEIIHEGAKWIERPGQDQKAARFFELASSMAPVSSQIFFLQGVAFYQKAKASKKIQWVGRCIERFQKASELALESQLEKIWLSKAHFLWFELTQDTGALESAKDEAEAVNASALEVNQQAEFFALLGGIWRHYAQIGGEPVELHQALAYLKKSLEIKPSVGARIDIGFCYIALSKVLGRVEWLQEGLKCFETLLNEGCCDHGALCALAHTSYELYIQNGHRHLAKRSLEAFIQAFEKEKPRAEDTIRFCLLCVTLAEIEKDTNYLKSLRTWLGQCFELPSAERQIWLWHAQYLQAGTREDMSAIKLLEAELKAKVSEYESSTHYWLVKGMCRLKSAEYYREIGDLFEAIDALQRGLSLDHDRPALWLNLARCYMIFADIQQEPEAYKKASQLFAMAVTCGRFSEEFWLEWGIAFLRLADATGERSALSDAIVRFEKSLQMISRDQLPKNLKLLYHYGSALDFLGDLQRDEDYYEKSCEVLQEVLRHDSNFTEARCALAVAMTHMGEASSDMAVLKQASELFSQLCMLDHEDEYLWNEWAVCLLSIYRLNLEDEQIEGANAVLEDAMAKLQRSLNLGNYHALYNMCCACVMAGELPKALKYLKRTFEAGIHPPIEDILEDEWLEPLKKVEGFQELVENRKKEIGEDAEETIDSDDDDSDLLPS